MNASYIAELMRTFLGTVRPGASAHPYPCALADPAAAGPDCPNAAGSTLQDLRDAIEDAVTTYRDCNHDENVHLLSGAGLVPGEALVDGIHHDDDGHGSRERRLHVN